MSPSPSCFATADGSTDRAGYRCRTYSGKSPVNECCGGGTGQVHERSGADLNRHDAGDSRDGEGAQFRSAWVVVGRERSTAETKLVNARRTAVDPSDSACVDELSRCDRWRTDACWLPPSNYPARGTGDIDRRLVHSGPEFSLLGAPAEFYLTLRLSRCPRAGPAPRCGGMSNSPRGHRARTWLRR